MADFTSERKIGAAHKDHCCDGCGQLIAVGLAYVRWSGISEGTFGTLAYHRECRAAEIALNRNYDFNSDEWVSLMNNRERDDDDWLRAEWPLVAARLGIVAP